MKLLSRTKALALAAATVTVATTLTAAPSQAYDYPLWLYEHTGYNGYSIALYSSDSNLWNRGFSDATSSVRNVSSVAYVLYDDSGYSDRRYCIRSGESISNLHNDAWKFGDKISSVKKLGSNSCEGYPRF
jgi:Beta/Gamma crystallin